MDEKIITKQFKKLFAEASGAVMMNDLVEFADFFMSILTELKRHVDNSVSKNDQYAAEVYQKMFDGMEDIEARLKKMIDKSDMGMEKKHREIVRMCSEMRDLIPNMPDMASYDEKLASLQNMMPKTTDEHIAKMSDKVDKIAMATEKIEKLEKDIDELKKQKSSPATVGGGISNMRIQQAFKYILKTEEPVGDVDGVNLTYRLSQPIFAIFSMSMNGEVIAQLPNYTINGNTFTFTTALPASYAEKDWEVKYI